MRVSSMLASQELRVQGKVGWSGHGPEPGVRALGITCPLLSVGVGQPFLPNPSMGRSVCDLASHVAFVPVLVTFFIRGVTSSS